MHSSHHKLLDENEANFIAMLRPLAGQRLDLCALKHLTFIIIKRSNIMQCEWQIFLSSIVVLRSEVETNVRRERGSGRRPKISQ